MWGARYRPVGRSAKLAASPLATDAPRPAAAVAARHASRSAHKLLDEQRLAAKTRILVLVQEAEARAKSRTS